MVFGFIFWLWNLTSAEKVLLTPMSGSPLTSTIYYGKKLHERGHEISLLISREWADVADYSHIMTNGSFYTTYIFSCGDDFKPFGGGDKVQDADTFFKHFIEFLFDTKMPWFVRPIFHNLFGSLALANVHHNTAICTSKFFLPENQNIVKFIEETKFDLIIADPIEMLGPLLSWKYDIPLSFNTRWAMYGDAGEILTDAQSTTQARMISDVESTINLSFLDRLVGVFITLYNRLSKIAAYPIFYKEPLRIWGYPGDMDDLLREADLWLFRYNFLFEKTRPLYPNQIPVGAFKCSKGNTLSQEYQDFVKDGEATILISFGSMVKTLPKTVIETFLKVFEAFPEYRFIWRIIERPEGTPENVKTAAWIPQVDILSDSKTEVFISHCGNHGAHESLFNGVPMIGIPLMFDQFYIANRLRDINMGLKLLPQDVTPESVIDSINEILNGDYQETARQLKFKIENQPQTDLERALNELEYLMKIKNFDHLKPQKISSMEYYNLDVFAFILSLSIIFILNSWLLLKAIFNFATLKKTKND